MTSYKKIVTLAQQAQQAIAHRNYTKALSTYNQAFKLAKPLNHPHLISVLLGAQGKVLEKQGEIQDAVIAYEAALEALSKNKKNLEALNNLIGQFGQVRKGFYASPDPLPDLYSPEFAQNLDEAITDPALAIKLCINIGNAYLRQPQENPALNAYQQALAHKRINKHPLLKAYAKANSSEIFRRQNKTEQAEAALSEALELFKVSNEQNQSRQAIALLAGIKRNQAKLEEAITLYEQAIDLYHQADDLTGHTKTLSVLAYLHITQKDFDKAEPLYSEASNLLPQIRDDEMAWHILWGLGCCRYQQKNFIEAIDYFSASIKLIERRQKVLRTDEGKVTFLDSTKDIFDQLLLSWLSLAEEFQNNPDQDSEDISWAYTSALAVAERARGRALHDMMNGQQRQRRVKSSQTDITVNDEEQIDSNPSELELLTLNREEWALALELNQDSDKTPQQRAVTTSTSKTSSTEDSLPEPVQAKSLARLVFYVLLDRTAIFAVSPEGKVTGQVAPIGCHALEERIAQLRHALAVDEAARGVMRKATVVDSAFIPHTHSTPPLEEQLQTLYTDLISPIENALPTAGQTLVIEPHNVLWLVPFAALKMPNNQWMGDRWPLIYTPSHRTLKEIRQEPPYAAKGEAKAVIVGNPVMPNASTQKELAVHLGPLPGAEQEAKAIYEVLSQKGATLLLGSEATESRVKELSQTHNIVHLATHGIAYTTDPLASFVAFSPTAEENGLLTAREVATNRSLPLDLVVLSACQTGLGKISGEGMLGLSRAFLIAGARTVVVSQWSVSDMATTALMVAFYQAYSQNGEKAIALQKAMASVRNNPDYQHPRYWAAFVLVGAEN